MPRNLLSQLGHVELLSPRPQESVEFARDILGLEESHREGQSVWFRGWGEHHHHSLVVTEADTAALGHVGWRTYGAEELELAVANLEASGHGVGWVEGQVGHGPAYRFRSPEGHVNEVFWEVERWRAPPQLRSRLLNSPQRYFPRGMGFRRIDHCTLKAAEVEKVRGFYLDTLRFRHMESFHLDHDGREVAAFLTNTPMSHDLGLIGDVTGVPGRFDHVAFWVDSVEQLHHCADIARELPEGIELGPERHAVGQNFCLYFREPGGNRIEAFTGPGYFIYDPDWEPVHWKTSEGPGSYYGREIPIAFSVRATPRVEEEERFLQAGALSGAAH